MLGSQSAARWTFSHGLLLTLSHSFCNTSACCVGALHTARKPIKTQEAGFYMQHSANQSATLRINMYILNIYSIRWGRSPKTFCRSAHDSWRMSQNRQNHVTMATTTPGPPVPPVPPVPPGATEGPLITTPAPTIGTAGA